VTVGSATTALTALLFVALDASLPVVAANIASMAVGTIAANEMHARWTFRSPKRGLRMHTEAGFTTLVTWILSSGALLTLERLDPDAGSLVKIAVQVGATAVAGTVRYLVLLVWVFAVHRHYPDAHDVGSGVALPAPAVSPVVRRRRGRAPRVRVSSAPTGSGRASS